VVIILTHPATELKLTGRVAEFDGAPGRSTVQGGGKRGRSALKPSGQQHGSKAAAPGSNTDCY